MKTETGARKNRMLKPALSLLVVFVVSGCATPPTQEQTGAVIGGALGGLLGAQVGSGSGRTAAIIAGTLAGAAVGGSIGRTMDDVDRQRVQRTLETARDNEAVTWVNPNSGTRWEATPTQTYRTAAGTDCREYTIRAEIDGRMENVVGTACRDASGRWVNQ